MINFINFSNLLTVIIKKKKKLLRKEIKNYDYGKKK